MKIACLQLEPHLGKVQRNIDHATKMVAELKPGDVDVLVLPEMAFTGYVFTSKDHIRSYLEDAENGPSVLWAKSQAVRLKAHVQVGYPERRVLSKHGEDHEEYYNSICFVSPEGQVIATYAKHFLYYTDENWAEEGPEFMSIPVKKLGQVGFGICMDVNPYKFKADFSAFEFSNFHRNNNTELMLCSMAWNKGEEAPKKAQKPSKKSVPASTTNKGIATHGDTQDVGASDDNNNSIDDLDEEDWEDEEDEDESILQLQYETIQYWAVRMQPFYAQKRGSNQPQDAYIAIANRIGLESGALFVGSSCVLRLRSTGPELVGALPANKEGVLLVEI